jgi:hypothetical protein
LAGAEFGFGRSPGCRVRRSLLDMFMRVVRSSIDPAKIDEALLLADEMMPR